MKRSAGQAPDTPRFWRDAALPFIEARAIDDGRQVCYSRHAHETFSIGVVRGGQSSYLNEGHRERIAAGAVVVMNPGDVHACNPIADQPWAYRMLYVDSAWLVDLQRQLGFDPNQDFHAFAPISSRDARLYAALDRFFNVFTAPHAEPLLKQSAALAFFDQAHRLLNPAPRPPRDCHHKLERAAHFINDSSGAPLRLEDICAAADLSPSYLIRAFKKRYRMTPHAYLLNRRIQVARELLKRGEPIASAALAAGFADQSHLQRAFKQFLAATPGQYRAHDSR